MFATKCPKCYAPVVAIPDDQLGAKKNPRHKHVLVEADDLDLEHNCFN
jgi:hypothetical protein